MVYDNIKEAVFINRPNRFIAHIEIEGKIEVAHVKNTGRCKEILVPGAKVYVAGSGNKNRKTKYDLISAYKGNTLINIDSQVPNRVFLECADTLFKNITKIKSEYAYKNSRFDFYIEQEGKKILAEIKGVTLEEEGVAMFPDAPTTRGVKHLKELISWVKEGNEAYVIFIIQMRGVKYFTPNSKTHLEFAKTLKEAKDCGVKVVAIDSHVTKNEIKAGNFVDVVL